MRQPCTVTSGVRPQTAFRRCTLTLIHFSLAGLLLLQATALHADPTTPELRQWLTRLAIPDSEPFTHQVTGHDLAHFYAARDFRPVWTQPGQRLLLQQAITTLREDGFDPGHYPVSGADDWQLCDELTATASFLQAVLHLHFGLVDRERVEPLWRYQDSDRPSRRQRLLEQTLLLLDTPAEAFERARPAVPLYPALRHAYRELSAQSAQPPWPQVAAGPSLRPDLNDPRVTQLRARLAAGGYQVDATGLAAGENPDPQDYDPALQQAVRAFQHDHTLAVDGIVGPATLAELNLSRSARLDQLRANLERLRWHAGEYEPHMVLVDIAGGLLQYYRDAALQWQARTQVGTTSRRTPDLKSSITHFTFNPAWVIPPTILRHDKLPRIRTDPNFLANNHLQVLDSDGNLLDPDTVDWDRPGAIRLRQAPGPENPLGQVAIRFPNPFAVYLHDTPSQWLFERAQRTVSSGCVRVEQATRLVDQLIADASDYSNDYIATVIDSGRTGNIRLATPVPLLMDYWTTDLDATGRIVFRPDIYQRDAALAAALQQLRPAASLTSCGL